MNRNYETKLNKMLAALKRFLSFDGSTWIIIIYGMLVLSLNLHTMWYNHVITKKIDQASNLENQIKLIQDNIRLKQQGYQRLNKSLIDFIVSESAVKLQCNRKQPLSLIEQDEKCDRNRKLLQINAGIEQGLLTFNKEVISEMENFIAFDKSYLNLCTKDTPSDKVWEEKYLTIRNLMDQAIQKEQNHLNDLIQQYAKIDFS